MWNFSEQLRFVIKVFCSNNKTKEYVFQAFDGLKENRKRNYHKMGYNVETFANLAKKTKICVTSLMAETAVAMRLALCCCFNRSAKKDSVKAI